MIDFRPFYRQIAESPLSAWLETLPLQLKQWEKQTHGEYAKWVKSVELLPDLKAKHIDLKSAVCSESVFSLSDGQKTQITHLLKQLMPWRKGPYHLHGIHIDCEWRSDFKWDPTELFLCQFEAVRKLLNNDRHANLIPIGIEDMQPLGVFDTVFSMGVLYHRKSPLDHLSQLRNQLRKGGELVLETLVIDGDVNSVLVPPDRYAKMKNVYFIPSVDCLINWLQKTGFKNIRCVDVALTTLEEQRKTDWLENESLIDFLDPQDHRKTIEGHPAPKRAVILAEK